MGTECEARTHRVIQQQVQFSMAIVYIHAVLHLAAWAYICGSPDGIVRNVRYNAWYLQVRLIPHVYHQLHSPSRKAFWNSEHIPRRRYAHMHSNKVDVEECKRPHVSRNHADLCEYFFGITYMSWTERRVPIRTFRTCARSDPLKDDVVDCSFLDWGIPSR